MADLNPSFGDREILEDLLSSQKQITAEYNAAANECASSALQGEFMTLLGEEHQIQMELFQEMQKRGWYPVQKAPQQKIAEVKEQFTGTNS
ncbi:MAG: spore coat protein [Angelakisella sp.]|jgi:spore coat protein CotF|nr:spore coat protein [Angelakisella sp.]